jgi:hypothetical protein
MLSLLPHHHTGRIRPHEHTSYLPLIGLLLVVALSLSFYTLAAAQSPGPAAGSIGLTGAMPGKPPTTAAVITKPGNGQHFSATPINVAGTCPENTLVEIFKNDIFAGSSICSADGKFSVDIDLMVGQNRLIARVYDNLNQQGPDSNVVIVFYDALPPNAAAITPLDFGGAQFLINTDAIYRGMFPNKEFQMPIELIGGTPPFAINIQYGDAGNNLISRPNNVTFKAGHTYKKPGTYQIDIQGTDSTGRVAFISVASIVNGQPPVGESTKSEPVPFPLWLLWVALAAAALIVGAFFLGERREKKVLQKKGLLVQT